MESYSIVFWVILGAVGCLMAGSVFIHIYTLIQDMKDLKGGAQNFSKNNSTKVYKPKIKGGRYV
jgi:hypothetical protein